MSFKAILTLTAYGLLFISCQAQSTKSARRYVDCFEIDRVSAATDPQTEIVKTQFKVFVKLSMAALRLLAATNW